LLQAVFAEGLQPLEAMNEQGTDDLDQTAVLRRFQNAIRTLPRTSSLPVIMAAQSDVELRDVMAAKPN